jgi:dihydrofolate reductase
MNMSVDGFVTKNNHELDWLTYDWGKTVHDFTINNLEKVDFILMTFGKKPDATFITFWNDTAKKPEDPYFEIAKKIASTPKIILTEYPIDSEYPNTKIRNGKVIDEVKKLKNENGKKILVYGGVTFASSLVKNNLIDEFYFLVNPVAL